MTRPRAPRPSESQAMRGYGEFLQSALRRRGLLFELAWPPTVNTYWRNVQGRTLLSKRGREYKRHIATAVVLAGYKGLPLEGELRLNVDAYPPDNRKRDLSNLLKGLEDAMQAAGVFRDDYQIADLRIVRRSVEPPGRVVVRLEPLPDGEVPF